MFSKIKSVMTNKSDDIFIGIINEDGVGKSFFDDEYTMTFSFIAFVKNDGTIQEKEAVIFKTIPSLNYEIEGLEPLSIVKISGTDLKTPNQYRINLISIIKTNCEHQGLDEIVARRTNPVRLDIPNFGIFTLDKLSKIFETELEWDNSTILLSFSSEIEKDEIIPNAKRMIENAVYWNQKFKDRIAEELLSLKNETWIEENESPITARELNERIKLISITFYSQDEFEANFSDDNIFYGHIINLSGNLNGTLGNPTLYG